MLVTVLIVTMVGLLFGAGALLLFKFQWPFETEEISYLVKIDVKIDDGSNEEEDKDYYDDDLKGADELAGDNMDDDPADDSSDYDM